MCTACALQAEGVAQLDAAVQRARRTQLALQDAAQLVSLLNEHCAARVSAGGGVRGDSAGFCAGARHAHVG